MNPVHIHLLLNHVAILGAAFSVLIFLYGYFRKNNSVTNVALIGFVMSALATIPVFLTGEPSEEAVENLPGVIESVIEQHEEVAEVALWLIELCGLLALGKLLLKNIQFFRSTAFGVIMAIISIVSASAIMYTGYLGGKIRHTEIAGASAKGINQQENSENGDDD